MTNTNTNTHTHLLIKRKNTKRKYLKQIEIIDYYINEQTKEEEELYLFICETI